MFLKINTKIDPVFIGIVILTLSIPLWAMSLADINNIVLRTEQLGHIILLLNFIYFLTYALKLPCSNDSRIFWFWASSWWLLLLGRSLNWGREFFPYIPRPFFKIIGAILIGITLFMLLSPKLRHVILSKLKEEAIPFWYSLLAVVLFFVVDSIDKSRYFSTILFGSLNGNLLEELFEIPLVLCLMIIALYYKQLEKNHFYKEVALKNKYYRNH